MNSARRVGVIIYNRRGLEKFLSEESNRQSIVLDLLENNNGFLKPNSIPIHIAEMVSVLNNQEEELVEAIADIFDKPWVTLDEMSVAGSSCPVVAISYGHDMPDGATDLSSVIHYHCHEYIIWHNDSWV